jgi:hypothetical protein
MAMNHRVKAGNTDQDLINEFLKNGGKVEVGATKPMPNELHISNNTWNNKLTKAERVAKDGK